MCVLRLGVRHEERYGLCFLFFSPHLSFSSLCWEFPMILLASLDKARNINFGESFILPFLRNGLNLPLLAIDVLYFLYCIFLQICYNLGS